MSNICEKDYQAILLDIEGTTTSISFVKETLFPFVKENMKEFLTENWEKDASLKEILHFEDLDNRNLSKEDLIHEIMGKIRNEMDKDLKTTWLKAFQGRVWQKGYSDGLLKGHIYEDVPKAFERWTRKGKNIYIYSSGSVQAQKLIFGFSEAGDLCKYISGYFDTTSGPKIESSSYKTISESIKIPSDNVLFLTDIPNEAYVAKDCGMDSILMIRPGNKELEPEEKTDFKTLKNFNDIYP